MNKQFIETKEYKRFAEFCDVCIKYKYIGICYGVPGVGKTLSSIYYCNWDNIEPQFTFRRGVDIGKDATDEILTANKLFYTAPAEKMTRVSSDIHTLATRTNLVRTMYLVHKYNQKETYASNSYEGIDLIIIDEIYRLKLQHLEQLRDIYDKNDLALVLVGMPGIEKNCLVIRNYTRA